MSTINSTSAFVRPPFFIISGFTNIPHINYYYVFLFFCYVAAVMGNLLLMTIIIIERRLHTPKYMAVFMLALADLGETTALIPKLLETFLFNAQEITYEACLTNMFFVFFFFGVQSLTLIVLAYDRFVAICFPLRYHSIVTNTSIAILIAMAWLINLILVSFLVVSVTRLSFCNSIVINSFFCDYGPVYRMACNDNSLSKIIALLNITVFIFIPLTLVGVSYTCILLALFKIASWEERVKALKTCLSHFILVSVFFLPVLGIHMAVQYITVHVNVRIINSSLSYAVPPVLNPIVYSLNTAEIKEFVKKLFRRKMHKAIVPAVSK